MVKKNIRPVDLNTGLPCDWKWTVMYRESASESNQLHDKNKNCFLSICFYFFAVDIFSSLPQTVKIQEINKKITFRYE